MIDTEITKYSQSCGFCGALNTLENNIVEVTELVTYGDRPSGADDKVGYVVINICQGCRKEHQMGQDAEHIDKNPNYD